MRSKKWLFRVSLSLLLMLLVTACLGEPGRYRYTVDVAGGPAGWPVWVEDVTFSDSWGMSGGYIGAGIEQRPPNGASYILDNPKAIPDSVTVRWFSYRTQTFYEVALDLPDDLNKKLQSWYEKYPSDDYTHTLIVGASGKGEVLVWWRVYCLPCQQSTYAFSSPIIENAKATIVDGDLTHYDVQTQELIDEGTIPSPW